MALNIVKTKKGDIRGIEMEGYTVYKGIPYAKPPLGNLRFKAPVELEPWTDILNADHFSNRSLQMGQIDFYKKEFYDLEEAMTPMDEDSLYLNIWTPANTTEEKLPVAFWIHGGAFVNGYGHEKEFDGESYCKKGVILVTINYRLAALGFLVHPWLIEENPDGFAGNYGIHDQIAALKWVYENIEAFGGNSNNITVMGQSAGAMSAQTLISSDLTNGMIAKAIFQSGGGYENGLIKDWTREDAIEAGKIFVCFCNVHSLDELRELSKDKILEASAKTSEYYESKHKGLAFVPVIDGNVLKGGYNELAKGGIIKEIPYMLGSTKNDIFTSEVQIQNGDNGMLYNGCIRWSQLLEKLGRKPAYVYYFTRNLLGDDTKAFHSAELWYMFGTLNRSWRPKDLHDYELSRQMINAWTNFIKTGNPNSDMNEWGLCSIEEPFIKEFQ